MDLSYSVDPYSVDPGRYNGHFDNNNTRLDAEDRGRSKPPQLNTARLKPYRQVTRPAVLSVLETGHVSLEFLKRRDGQERVAEIFVVSGDGSEICVEQWQAGSPAVCGNSDQTWKTFSYSNLPEKYWKKYAHAYRFVGLVKSKTAKVTMYSDHAKGVLMENSPPSFEVTFYHAGPRIVLTGSEVYIKEDSGASLIFSSDNLHNLVNDYTMGLVKHATQMREQCLRLEASVATVEATNQTGEALFPITVGARPFASFCSSTSSASESLDHLSTTSCSSPHPARGLSSSPSDHHSGSPPASSASPVPILDFRSIETPRKAVPTPEPSPVKDRMQCSLSSACQTGSPYRHVSTLEGRKMRRQLSSASTESSGMEGVSGLSAANSDSCCPIGLMSNDVAVRHSGTEVCHALGKGFCHNTGDVFHKPTATLINSESNFLSSQTSEQNVFSDEFPGRLPNFSGPQSPLKPAANTAQSPKKNFASSSSQEELAMPRTPSRVQQIPADILNSCSPFTSAMKTASAAMRSMSQLRINNTHKPSGADHDFAGVCSGTDFGAIPSADLLERGRFEGDSATSAAATMDAGTWRSDLSERHVPASMDESVAFLRSGGGGSSAMDESAGGLRGSSAASSGVSHLESSSPVVRQTFVPYTGWASQLADGAVWIRYNDGTQLGVQCSRAEIIYVDQDGTTHRFVRTDGIPEVVRLKLEKLPMVLDSLTTRPAAPLVPP